MQRLPPNWLIYSFGILKLLLHFFTNTNYGLHRDEYLYFDQGKQLSWGFYEVPPMTPFLGKIADILGGSVFSIRLFPALAGALIIILALHLVKQLGGGRWAILFGGFGLLLSPSLLGSNTLFQPVSFNQLNWFIIAYLIVQLITKANNKTYWMLGGMIGLAFLTKYSVVFYLVALLAGLLLTQQRRLLNSKYTFLGLALAFIIALPNIIWQFTHDFPLVDHMRELQDSQLAHINWGHYLISLITEHKGFSFVWLAGLIGLFTLAPLKKYKSLSLAFILVILLIGFLQGKPYYALGAFLILFPFGGIALEQFIKSNILRIIGLLFMFSSTLPFYPLSLPILKVEKLKKYTRYLSQNYGINYMLRWEDDNYYELPQDIADMHGWEELSQKVSKLYHGLPSEQKATCMIMGGSYGHISSMNYYREKYNLPEIYSFNGSYAFIAPEEVNFDNQILIDDRRQDGSDWFANMILVDSLQHEHAREKGYIYYRTEPKIDLNAEWKRIVRELNGKE